MEQSSLLMKTLAEENKKISDALEAVGYQTIKIDIAQIGNAKNNSIDIQIWARTKEKN